jgi:hypothetical protein
MRKMMTISNKHMMIALIIATMFVIFNIIAVLSGTAITFYSKLDQLVFELLPTFNFS